MIIGLFIINAFSGCKDKPATKAPVADINETNRASCTSNHGTWQNTACQCTNGYKQDPSSAFRCVEDVKAIGDCTTQPGTHWDVAQNRCIADGTINPADLTASKTAKDCFDRKGWWNGITCATTVPTTEIDCRKTGDQWANNTCAQINPYDKQAQCTTGRGKWSDAGCACENGYVFDWRTTQCYANNGNGSGGPGQYSPEQACRMGYGQWTGTNCVCPNGTQYDQNMGRCVPVNNYNQYCPGQFDYAGNCMALTGKQMVFNLLYGWVLQNAFLDDPDRPADATIEPSGDGH
jgi:hypothetical protein